MAFTIDAEELSAMREVDLQTVDKSALVDIRTVQIDPSLPQPERAREFIRQIKNPYCFLCGKLVVKVRFAEDDMTLEERLIGYFQSLNR